MNGTEMLQTAKGVCGELLNIAVDPHYFVIRAHRSWRNGESRTF